MIDPRTAEWCTLSIAERVACLAEDMSLSIIIVGAIETAHHELAAARQDLAAARASAEGERAERRRLDARVVELEDENKGLGDYEEAYREAERERDEAQASERRIAAAGHGMLEARLTAERERDALRERLAAAEEREEAAVLPGMDPLALRRTLAAMCRIIDRSEGHPAEPCTDRARRAWRLAVDALDGRPVPLPEPFVAAAPAPEAALAPEPAAETPEALADAAIDVARRLRAAGVDDGAWRMAWAAAGGWAEGGMAKGELLRLLLLAARAGSTP